MQEKAAHDGGREPTRDGERRARQARDLVRELRRRRFDRPPGATARDLLEQTAGGRAVALGPSGEQRLARPRKLCLVLELLAATESLDYGAATARLRQWAEDPIQLDPPYPVGADAVQAPRGPSSSLGRRAPCATGPAVAARNTSSNPVGATQLGSSLESVRLSNG